MLVLKSGTQKKQSRRRSTLRDRNSDQLRNLRRRLPLRNAVPVAESTATETAVTPAETAIEAETEAEEILSTPAPSTAAERLDLTLMQQDVGDTERANIISTLNRFEQGARAAGVNLDTAINFVHRFNTAARDELQGKFGRVKVDIDGNTYSLVMELLLDPNTPITDNFINAFANVWVDLWEKSNAISYNSVVKYLKDNGIDYSKSIWRKCSPNIP